MAHPEIVKGLGVLIWDRARLWDLELGPSPSKVEDEEANTRGRTWEYNPYDQIFTWHKLYHAEMDHRRSLGEDWPVRCGRNCRL